MTFQDGRYTYVCDPHSGTMNGAFTVGNVPTTPTPPAAAITPRTKLRLTSGPGFTITLATAAGKAVKSMKRGTYTVVVRDRGFIHNAHVVAPGYNRRTTPLAYVGTQTWKVKLVRTGTLRFLCDPHALTMKGSAEDRALERHTRRLESATGDLGRAKIPEGSRCAAARGFSD